MILKHLIILLSLDYTTIRNQNSKTSSWINRQFPNIKTISNFWKLKIFSTWVQLYNFLGFLTRMFVDVCLPEEKKSSYVEKKNKYLQEVNQRNDEKESEMSEVEKSWLKCDLADFFVAATTFQFIQNIKCELDRADFSCAVLLCRYLFFRMWITIFLSRSH